jgi:hypothetical protein
MSRSNRVPLRGRNYTVRYSQVIAVAMVKRPSLDDQKLEAVSGRPGRPMGGHGGLSWAGFLKDALSISIGGCSAPTSTSMQFATPAPMHAARPESGSETRFH